MANPSPDLGVAPDLLASPPDALAAAILDGLAQGAGGGGGAVAGAGGGAVAQNLELEDVKDLITLRRFLVPLGINYSQLNTAELEAQWNATDDDVRAAWILEERQRMAVIRDNRNSNEDVCKICSETCTAI